MAMQRPSSSQSLRHSPSGSPSAVSQPSSSTGIPHSRYVRRIPVLSSPGPPFASSEPAPASVAVSPSLHFPLRNDREHASSPTAMHGLVQSAEPMRSLSSQSAHSITRRPVPNEPSMTSLAPERGSSSNPNPHSPPTNHARHPQGRATHILQVDPPSSSYEPRYPPPPQPKRASHPKPSTKVIASQKRDAFLRHRQEGASQVEVRQAASVQRSPTGKNPGLRDGHLTPPMSPGSNPQTWDLSHELNHLDLPRDRIAEDRLKKEQIEPFSVEGIPNAKRIWEAGMCDLVDETGSTVKFKNIISNKPGRKTLCFFIRHFWCGQCQNFMDASIVELNLKVLQDHDIDVVIISNGHWQIIRKYREIFKCPFPIYVDCPRRLYNFLGMKLSNDFGSIKQDERAKYNTRTVPHQLAAGIGNGLFRMPLRDFGKLAQLGGEFIFGPSTVCHFAHRMTNTSDHMEAIDVAARAGINPELFDGKISPNTSIYSFSGFVSENRVDKKRQEGAAKQTALAALQATEWQRDWELRREAELDRMRRRKLERRAGRSREAGMEASVVEEELETEDRYPTSAGVRKGSSSQSSHQVPGGIGRRSSIPSASVSPPPPFSPPPPPAPAPAPVPARMSRALGPSGSSEGYARSSRSGGVPSHHHSPTPKASSSVSLAEMSDAELEVEMELRRRARIRAQEAAIEEERRAQAWTDEQQQAELARASACVVDDQREGAEGDLHDDEHYDNEEAYDEGLEYGEEGYDYTLGRGEAGQVYDLSGVYVREGAELQPRRLDRSRQSSLTSEDLIRTAHRFPVPTTTLPPISGSPNRPLSTALPPSSQPYPPFPPNSSDHSAISPLTSPTRSPSRREARLAPEEPPLHPRLSFESLSQLGRAIN